MLFFLITSFCDAQTKKIDNLLTRLKKTETKYERLNTILTICEEYQSLNRDTLYNLALEAKLLAASQPDKEKKGLAATALSNAYMQWGWIDSALAVLEPMLTNEKNYSESTYFKMQRSNAMIYGSRAEYEKALSILFPALNGAEKWKDTLNIAAISNSIGSVSLARGKPDEALLWIQKAAALSIGNDKYKPVLAAAYTNAANAYLQKGDLDSSNHYIELAVTLCRVTENLFILATALRLQVNILTIKKKFAEAELALKEMITTRKLTRGTNFFVEDNIQLADFYANTGQLDKAIEFCLSMLKTGNVYDTASAQFPILTNDPKLRLEFTMALAKYYKQGNRLKEYQETLEQILLLKDSLYEANSAQAIAESETKYEVQKKENTILQQKYSLQKNRFLLSGSIALLVMTMIISYFIFRDYRRKQKIKMNIALAEEQAKAEIYVQKAEEKERMRIAADLHDNIGAYASAIRTDVDKIAQGNPRHATNNLRNLQQHSQEIMNSLRDTIWVLNKENITITGISDRIKDYVNKLRPSYENVQFSIEEDITNDIRVNSQTALNIFRIVQETIHNSLKHSNASNVNITVQSSATTTVTINDNGKGMDKLHQNKNGNGFINMQARAAESKLNLFVNSVTDAGTSVRIELPTTN
ncbi:MAG: hypothetical protein HY252_04940 [Sphingobacteriales bacterium]|nr:hypothetical protein [Sphingobacteriales bacterium]